jgi:choline dehydrogenase-like flavoprotein
MEEFSPIIVSFQTSLSENNNNHRLTETGGKGLGGSSTINGFYYGRGTSTVYDLWESRGNPGWSWDDVYPLFIRVSSKLYK